MTASQQMAELGLASRDGMYDNSAALCLTGVLGDEPLHTGPSEQCQACSRRCTNARWALILIKGWKGGKDTGPGAGTQVQGPIHTSPTAGSTGAAGYNCYHC